MSFCFTHDCVRSRTDKCESRPSRTIAVIPQNLNIYESCFKWEKENSFVFEFLKSSSLASDTSTNLKFTFSEQICLQ